MAINGISRHASMEKVLKCFEEAALRRVVALLATAIRSSKAIPCVAVAALAALCGCSSLRSDAGLEKAEFEFYSRSKDPEVWSARSGAGMPQLLPTHLAKHTTFQPGFLRIGLTSQEVERIGSQIALIPNLPSYHVLYIANFTEHPSGRMIYAMLPKTLVFFKLRDNEWHFYGYNPSFSGDKIIP